jgi:hypothetical protein
MKAYEDLTPRGKLRRTGRIARAALKAYVFTEDRLRLIVDAARARKNNEKHGILTAVQKVIDFINEVNHNPCDYCSRNRRRIDDVQ